MRSPRVNYLLVLSVSMFLTACGNGDGTDQQAPAGPATEKSTGQATDQGEDATAGRIDSGDRQKSPPGTTASANGDPAHGEKLYNKTTIGGAPGCVTCHSLSPGTRLIGPSLADVATRAAKAVGGMSAEAYLRQSIVDPNAHVTEGFNKGLMYQQYSENLTRQQIDDLVAFLLTRQ